MDEDQACIYISLPIPCHSRDRGLEVIHSQNAYVLEFGFDLGTKEHSNSFSLTGHPG